MSFTTRRIATLLTLTLGLCWSASAEARCASASLSAWPPLDQTLPANGQIALEGYGTEQDFIRSLAGRSPRLVTRGQSIPLRVAEVQEGQFRITQAILVPEGQLTSGRRYTLRVDGRAHIQVWTDGGRSAVAWTAGAADALTPSWNSAPALRPSTYQRFGCGPAIFAHLAVSLSDNGPLRVRVRLEEVGSGQSRTYDVGTRDGEVAIGHGMCSGAYELTPGASYRVTLEAIDLAGNVAPAPGGALTFVGPSPNP